VHLYFKKVRKKVKKSPKLAACSNAWLEVPCFKIHLSYLKKTDITATAIPEHRIMHIWHQKRKPVLAHCLA